MNELQLSTDLNVITAEINSYKQVAGQSIFEIGRRLKHVRDNDLTYGEFGKWLNTVDMSSQQASRFIKVYEEIPQEKISDVGKRGLNALYEIATLPKEEREKEHKLNSGDTKIPDEMTNKELREVKRKLKQSEQAKQQAEQRATEAERSNELLSNLLDKADNKEPEVIEKEVIKEVDKTDYERIKKLERQIEVMKSNNEDIAAKEKEVKLLQLDASKSVLKTKISIDEFLQEVAVTSYRRGAIATSSEGTKNKLREGIDDLKNFITEMEMALDGTIQHQ